MRGRAGVGLERAGGLLRLDRALRRLGTFERAAGLVEHEVLERLRAHLRGGRQQVEFVVVVIAAEQAVPFEQADANVVAAHSAWRTGRIDGDLSEHFADSALQAFDRAAGRHGAANHLELEHRHAGEVELPDARLDQRVELVLGRLDLGEIAVDVVASMTSRSGAMPGWPVRT